MYKYFFTLVTKIRLKVRFDVILIINEIIYKKANYEGFYLK